MKRERTRCKHCGNLLENNYQKKYCKECAIEVERIKNIARGHAYRELHKDVVLQRDRKRREQNREKIRLSWRNYYQRHKADSIERVIEWRKNNPAKVKAINEQTYKKSKRRALGRMYSNGKRPLITETTDRTSLCKTCGREIPYGGHGMPRKYCDGCFPQITALKRVLHQMKYKEQKPDCFKEWYRDTKEHTVASVCIVCGCLIVYKGKGMIPFLCEICGVRRNLFKGRKRERLRKTPSDPIEFIHHERERLGLNRSKRWNKREILNLYRYYENRHPPPMAVDDE